VEVKKFLVFFVVIIFLSAVPVASAATSVSDPHDPNNPNDELNLYEVVNVMMGTSFTSSAQLGAYEITNDDWWHEWNGHISIVATYAGYDQNLWWENSTYSGDIFYIPLETGYSFVPLKIRVWETVITRILFSR
jgi:hypothetical protein